jgi:3-hydroxyisobutyrate dehydrogenase-like beta-hydroxyacid dehydrogenase
VTILWGEASVESIVTSDGFVEQLGRGGLHLAMSTISPEMTKKLAAMHAQHGSVSVEAPIFGGSEAAVAQWLWIPFLRVRKEPKTASDHS